ncbi:hypothetical protein JTE90_004374 [Oedothorax gibbosus]|uniref:Galectin n=1 Tax=Oedothorax gibbosus TaxID=931172 RepID=A0AAV6VKC1_9ARAC|nr:hypothetical protein JTE90_004374 [Oedothorax gibbosus]
MAEGKIASLVAPIKSCPGIHYKNPRFPVNVKLADNLECGTKIYIHGAAANDANRFAINLKNAEVDANNYFHFNPRFDEGVVVRNSRLDQAWGDEEREGDFPFANGEPFLITIIPNVDCYEVEVNGAPFITFNHREGMPLCDVTHIAMWGEVTVYGIHVPRPSMPLPLVIRIPKNTFYGDTLVLTGEAPSGAERFHVNFQCGNRDDADIMYHFNPRFDHNTLVCNNRCAEAWGDEETLDGLPVAPGERINVTIVAAKEGFMPFLNGNPLPIFPHRLDVCAACTILVDGDISLENLTLDCPPCRMPPQVPDVEIEEFDNKIVQALRSTAPVTMALLEGFGPGRAVYISGKIPEDASRFDVNLQCGEADADIALHFNPRWDDSDQGSVLVLNSRDDGAWGDEVREPNVVPSGSDFDMYILCQDDGFCIMLDGDVAVASFPHRIDCTRITHVSVNGCLEINRIMGV